MDIQHLNGASFAVYVGEEELRREHIDPAAMTDTDADRLLAGALSQLGRQRGERVCLELYPGRGDVLMFLRPAAASPLFFAFRDADALTAAAAEWNGGASSSLWYIDGRYVLSVWPWDADDRCDALVEFGGRLEHPAEYEQYLSEHGKALSSPDALGALRRAFAPK